MKMLVPLLFKTDIFERKKVFFWNSFKKKKFRALIIKENFIKVKVTVKILNVKCLE